MKRIDSLGSAAGRFSDGNPQLGQIATRLSAKWFNEVQDEIMHVIEASGLIPSHDVVTQLYDAMVLLVAGAVGTGGANVPTTRQILTGGLATGGGNLAADRTIVVTAASAAEVTAGLRNDVAMTPLGYAGAFGGAADILSLPGGWLIQKGSITGAYAEGVAFATLPTSFLSANYGLAITAINQSGNNDRDVFAQRVSKTASSFTAYLNYDGSGSNSIDGFDYIAIGR